MIIIRTYPAPEGEKWIKEIIDDGSIIWRKNTTNKNKNKELKNET